MKILPVLMRLEGVREHKDSRRLLRRAVRVASGTIGVMIVHPAVVLRLYRPRNLKSLSSAAVIE